MRRRDAITTLPDQHLPRSTGLAIVTVSHHSGAVLPDLARDLAAQSVPPRRWISVDNSPDSAPLAAAELRSVYPLSLELLTGEQGDGFGAGCNRAFSALAASGWDSWVWLLNPDTRLPQGDELCRLVTQLTHIPPTSLVGTAVVDAAGLAEANGGWIDRGLRFRRRCVPPRGEIDPKIHSLDVDWLSGCSLALRPTAHQPQARFDPKFPLYYEDMDLCLRLGRQRGAAVLWLPTPAVVHTKGSGSNSDSRRRMELSTISYVRFMRRHCSIWVLVLRSARLVLMSLANFPRRPGRSLVVLRAASTALSEGSMS